MDPITMSAIGLGVSAVGDIFKGISGYNQAQEGKDKYADIMRRRAAGEFRYTTPEQAYQSLNLSKGLYQSAQMPGQAAAQNQLEGNTSQAIELAKATGRTPAEIMAVITGANRNQNKGTTDLATSAAGFHIQNARDYEGKLSEMADYKDKEWAYNTYMPMMQDAQYAQDLIGAGNKNLYGAIGDFGSNVATAFSGGEDNPLASLFKKRTGGGDARNMNYFNAYTR